MPLPGLQPCHASPAPERDTPRPTRTVAGDRSHRLRGIGAHQAPDKEGFGMAAGYLCGPGPWRQLARPGPPALLCPDPQPSPLDPGPSQGKARRS